TGAGRKPIAFYSHPNSYTFLYTGQDTSRFITRAKGRVIELLDGHTGSVTRAVSHGRETPPASRLSADGKVLLTCGRSGRIDTFDAGNGKAMRAFWHQDVSDRLPRVQAAISPDNSRVVSWDESRMEAWLWDCSSGQVLARIKCGIYVRDVTFTKF